MIKFYRELDATTSIKDAEELMKIFFVVIFQLLRRNQRLGVRVLEYTDIIVPHNSPDHEKKHRLIEKSIKYAKRRQDQSLAFERKMLR